MVGCSSTLIGRDENKYCYVKKEIDLRKIERNTESWKEIILKIEGKNKSCLPWNPEATLNPELPPTFPGLFYPLSSSSKVSQYQIFQPYWDTLNKFWDS